MDTDLDPSASSNPLPGGVQVPCRCVWHGVACAKEATQEDGFCDWCGVRRDEDLRGNPFALVDPLTDEVQGLGGGSVTGYNHQAGWDPIPDDVRPTACWMERLRPPSSDDMKGASDGR